MARSAHLPTLVQRYDALQVAMTRRGAVTGILSVFDLGDVSVNCTFLYLLFPREVRTLIDDDVTPPGWQVRDWGRPLRH